MMRVTETVHHGTYYNVRTVELPDDAWLEDVYQLTLSCPYRIP